jgi:hypothetical protein
LGTDDKGGSNLDDLKARLGLSSVLAPAAKKEEAAPEGADAAATGPRGAVEGGPVSGAGPSVEEMPSGDYSAAVSTVEDEVAGEGEPDPVVTDSSSAVDPGLKTPLAGSARGALIIGAAVLLLLALGLGFGFGRVMGDREHVNRVIDASAGMLTQIQPTADTLTAFESALAAEGDEYTTSLDAVFGEFYGGTISPVIGGHHLYDAGVLMSASQDLARALLSYSRSTELLAQQVTSHMRRSRDDRANIENLLSGQAEDVSYGVVFDNPGLNQGWSAFLENAEENPYEAPHGTVVTFGELEIVVDGEGDSIRYGYEVRVGTLGRQIPLYNFLRVSRDQLVTNPNEETALTRYRDRVRAIRDSLNDVIRMQDTLLEQLDVQSSQPHTFTI